MPELRHLQRHELEQGLRLLGDSGCSGIGRSPLLDGGLVRSGNRIGDAEELGKDLRIEQVLRVGFGLPREVRGSEELTGFQYLLAVELLDLVDVALAAIGEHRDVDLGAAARQAAKNSKLVQRAIGP